MSSANRPDPRLLLPEWLRDGDLPASSETRGVQATVETQVAIEALTIESPSVAPTDPFSNRLSLDTSLDPGLLVSATDLPKWLGGRERTGSTNAQQPLPSDGVFDGKAETLPDDEPESVEELEPPQQKVIDVQVNGWIMVGGAVGLVVLLAAALTLYLS
jgi:hypothetical protein